MKKSLTTEKTETGILIDTKQSMSNTCKKQVLIYNNISPSWQNVVNILAVAVKPMTRKELVNCLNRLPSEGKKRKKITAPSLKPILDALMEKGLVETGIHNMPFCSESLLDAVCRELVSRKLYRTTAHAVWPEPASMARLRNFSTYDTSGSLRSKLRVLLYLGDMPSLLSLLSFYQKSAYFYSAMGQFEKDGKFIHPLLFPFTDSFDAAWVKTHLTAGLQKQLGEKILGSFNFGLFSPMEDHLVFCESLLPNKVEKESKTAFYTLLSECWMLAGKGERAESLASQADEMVASLIGGSLAFLHGDNEKAISLYEKAFSLLNRNAKKKKLNFGSFSGLFFILALIKSGEPKDLHRAKTMTEQTSRGDKNTLKHRLPFIILDHFIAARLGDPGGKRYLSKENPVGFSDSGLNHLFLLFALYWLDRNEAKIHVLSMAKGKNFFLTTSSPWIRAEFSLILSEFIKETDTGPAEKFFAESGYKSIVDLIVPESPWVQALNTLILMGSDPTASKTEKTSRLIWRLSVNQYSDNLELYPLEQVLTARGEWSKGRAISLKRLYHNFDEVPFLTGQDRKVCKCIEMHVYSGGWGGYTNKTYSFGKKALLALVGHPLVFSELHPGNRIDIVSDKPAILVRKKRNGELEMSFSENLATEQDIQIFEDSPSRIRVMETDEEVRRILRIVGRGIHVPAAGREQLLKAVASISSMITVQSEVEGIGEAAEMVAPDSRPHFYLRPLEGGLKLDIRVQPFEEGGPLFRPGEGAKTLISEVSGKRLGTHRDHDEERKLGNAALKACTPLSEMEPDSLWEWDLPDPETALEVLSALMEMKDQVILKWPDGKSFSIREKAKPSQLSLRVRKENDWFALSGELTLDDGLVLSMETLLDLVQESHGRFITLSDGQFLALTRSLKKQLEEMASFSKKSGKERRFHPLAALSLEPLAEEAGSFDGDKDWKAHVKRFKAAQSLQPELPSTLRAELRDYQEEGFNWLVRLMNWGAGACLADDMGLGKTVQALSALLTIGQKGPCLVVAPTSVCMNWEKEALRFAPSFNPVSFGTTNRDKILSNLKPFDLLIISYGLLQQEDVAEKLGLIPFAAIVLDEAQAIKNFATKRSQAAMNLKSDFRLITTGTPLENHLGELWNLFRFINPGLLGSLKSFNETFAIPIEKDRDRNAGQRLKKLIRPFILRRTKDQVLETLPARTDVQLQVDLSEEEMAFYEALRRKAIENIESSESPMENKRMQILAEIMKLRRACCNPALVAPDLNLPSAKLETFDEIVDELLANGHKALVFSQFTGHLDIIRKHVEKKGISYQYLDGSTPQKEREKRVTAFQAGEGDLFLISLRAGGVGLNLTAADYVIHMDPWWNPAVEDQASDRVHRIGQTRPVTVYSLVAKGTIEEKILGLHHSKRALADSLLDGADMSGKMSAEELLVLIREG